MVAPLPNGGPASLSLKVGSVVFYRGIKFYITNVLGFSDVFIKNAETGIVERVAISDLSVQSTTDDLVPSPDLQSTSEEKWEKARKRYSIIEPLLDARGRTRESVLSRANEFGVHVNTVYKWISIYESEEKLTALLPRGRSDKGSIRLPDEVERIIKDVIYKEYLTKQRKSILDVHNEVSRVCFNAGLGKPHKNTIRNRIAEISDELKISRRLGPKAAEREFESIKGKFPGADYPLSVWQIDHTQLDIILVDEINRRPIGRPWITLCIDVFSRLVAGFYISFDPPGNLSTGLTLVHGMLPKEIGLVKMGVTQEWPIWGMPAKIHADNAKEFRGNMLQRACEQYGITLEWRPVARPHYGAHIERLLGTFLGEIHKLPGTTKSNVQDRGEYDSEKEAIFTLSDLEKWLTNFIVDIYHVREHSALGMSPLSKYRQGIFGTKGVPGIGLPAKIVDEKRLKLDFMPFELRTVQKTGVVIDHIHYYHNVLRCWINSKDPEKPKEARLFMFRRDPRDISVIWFYDPQLERYFPIPYRNSANPAISIWELQESQNLVKKEGGDDKSEHIIFAAYGRLRDMESDAKADTKATRKINKKIERRGLGLDRAKEYLSRDELKSEPIVSSGSFIEVELDEVEPFDELDDMTNE